MPRLRPAHLGLTLSTRHRRRRNGRATTVVAVLGVLASLGLVGAWVWPGSPLATARSAVRSRTLPQLLAPAGRPTSGLAPLPVKATEIKISQSGWYSWALLDTRTGELSGPADRDQVSTTASLIKSWIGADFLRRTAEEGRQPSADDKEQIETMIRDSDNEAADALFTTIGREDSTRRMISICGLADSTVAADGGWSNTLMSPADITRLGACMADGRAAGPWTTYLLDQLRSVRDEGDFGIRKAFPEDQQKTIATKNGWVDREELQEYHVSCMAIGTGWVVGVMARYEIANGYAYGAKICELVGQELRKAAGG
jgi:hypothetical protein